MSRKEKTKSPKWKPVTIRMDQLGDAHPVNKRLSLIHACAGYLFKNKHGPLQRFVVEQLLEHNPIVVVKKGGNYRVVSNQRMAEIARSHLPPNEQIEVRQVIAPKDMLIMRLLLCELFRGIAFALEKESGAYEILSSLSQEELGKLFRHPTQAEIAETLGMHRNTVFNQKSTQHDVLESGDGAKENLQQRLAEKEEGV